MSALLGSAAPASAASLRATGSANVGAHRVGDQRDATLMPHPGSLDVIVQADANDADAGFVMQAQTEAFGVARYGSLAGRANATASSLPPGPYLAGGGAMIDPGFDDAGQVVSASLAPGTPVTLTFTMTLSAAAFHQVDGPDPNALGTGAAARFEVEVRDLDDITRPPSEGSLVINSRGSNETLRTLTFDTAVGRRLELIADLFVAANADVDFPLDMTTQASSGVVADNTAGLTYSAPGDVLLVTDSGHDYLVPEPNGTVLTGLGAALLSGWTTLRRRRAARP